MKLRLTRFYLCCAFFFLAVLIGAINKIFGPKAWDLGHVFGQVVYGDWCKDHLKIWVLFFFHAECLFMACVASHKNADNNDGATLVANRALIPIVLYVGAVLPYLIFKDVDFPWGTSDQMSEGLQLAVVLFNIAMLFNTLLLFILQVEFLQLATGSFPCFHEGNRGERIHLFFLNFDTEDCWACRYEKEDRDKVKKENL